MDKAKVVTDSIVIYIGSAIKSLRGLIFIPVIIACVGIDNYGAFIQIIINSQVVAPCCTLALGMCFLRFSSKYNENEIGLLSRDYWTVISTSILTSSLGAFVVYILSPYFSKFLLGGQHTGLIRLSSVLVITNVIWTQNNKYLKARKQFKLFSLFDFLYLLIPYLAFVVTILQMKDFSYGFIVFVIMKSGVILFIFLTIAFKLKLARPSIRVLKTFLKYSWTLPLSEVSGGLLSKVDRYFIGYFLGPAYTGIYQVVYTIVSLMQTISKPFNNYLMTYMPIIWDRGNTNRVVNQVKEILIYYLATVTITLVVLTFYADDLIVYLLKKNVPQVLELELLIFITGLGIISYGASSIMSVIIRCCKKNHVDLKFQSISLVINIILNFTLIPGFGLVGAGLATLISYTLYVVLISCFFGVDIDRVLLFKMLKILLSGLAVSWLYLNVESGSLLDVFLYIFIGLSMYAMLMFIMQTFTVRELRRRFF